jgi:hypothetical protein
MLVALNTTVRRAKQRIVRLCRLLMSVNTSKHGTGRKPCDVCQHFIQTDRMANKTQRFVRCVHCTDVFEKGVPGVREAVDVRGEKNAMESHLRQCKFYKMQDMQMSDPEPITSQAQHPKARPSTSSRTSTNHNSSKRTRQQPIFKYCPALILNMEKIEFHSLLLEFQAEANLPESFVSRQSFWHLIKFCNAEAAKVLPTRQLLGGPILNKYIDKVDSGDHATLKAAAPPGSRKRVNFLSDAWENIAKMHILGVILSLAGLCITFDTFTCGSRHDGLAIAEHLESILLSMIAQGWMSAPSSLTMPAIVLELDAY